MRADVHQAALRAAAKIAFSVVFLDACTNTTEDAKSAQASDLSNKCANDGAGANDAGAPSSDAAASCENVLASTFPTPGSYRPEPEAQSSEVIRCCDAELAVNGAASQYR